MSVKRLPKSGAYHQGHQNLDQSRPQRPRLAVLLLLALLVQPYLKCSNEAFFVPQDSSCAGIWS